MTNGGPSASTSTQRTYRYVRLGILGAVAALAVSVTAVVVVDGPLTSISAVHYTAGSGVFTGCLFAICLALVALAGRSPSQALLDLAALVAPLVAIMPTPIRTGDVPGLVVDCATPCIPDAELPAIANGLVTWFALASVVIVVAVVLGVVQGTASRGLLLTAGVAAATTVGAGVWWAVDPDGFVLGAHVIGASAFLALVAAVSGLAARRTASPYRGLYLAIAVAITVDLAAIVGVVLLRFVGVDLVQATGLPFVFVGEAIALGLFAVFWIAQTVQYWDDVDPALRVASPAVDVPGLDPR